MGKTVIIIACLFFNGCWLEKNTFVIWINDVTLSIIHKVKLATIGEKQETKEVKPKVTDGIRDYKIIRFYNESDIAKINLPDTIYSEVIPIDSICDSCEYHISLGSF